MQSLPLLMLIAGRTCSPFASWNFYDIDVVVVGNVSNICWSTLFCCICYLLTIYDHHLCWFYHIRITIISDRILHTLALRITFWYVICMYVWIWYCCHQMLQSFVYLFMLCWQYLNVTFFFGLLRVGFKSNCDLCWNYFFWLGVFFHFGLIIFLFVFSLNLLRNMMTIFWCLVFYNWYEIINCVIINVNVNIEWHTARKILFNWFYL